MPKQLTARPALDATEERHVRKLTHSVHAPADWIVHATIVAHSWEGLRTCQIAEALRCHPQTKRERLHAFSARGFEGLGMQPGGGRKPRLSEWERSTMLSLVHLPPPGKPTYELTGELQVPDPEGESECTLDALMAMARQHGIQVARSQVHLSSDRKGSAGGTPGSGRAARIRTSSPKGPDRRARHGPTRRRHRPLRRRTRPRNPTQFPACSWLVARWASHEGAPQL